MSAKFSDDGRELIVKGTGDVSIRIKYDDNPGFAGEDLSINHYCWHKVEEGEKKSMAKRAKTINVGKNDTKGVLRTLTVSKDRKRVNMKDGHGDDINSTFFIESSTNKDKFSADGKKLEYDGDGEITLTLQWDDNPKIAGVAVDKIEIGDLGMGSKRRKG